MSIGFNERVLTLETRADDMDARADAIEARGEACRGPDSEVDDDLVRDGREIATSRCDRLYGPSAAASRAARGIAAITGQAP